MAKSIFRVMQRMSQGLDGDDLTHSTQPPTISTLTTEPLR